MPFCVKNRQAGLKGYITVLGIEVVRDVGF